MQNYIKFQRKINVNPVVEMISYGIHVSFFFFLKFFLFFKNRYFFDLTLMASKPCPYTPITDETERNASGSMDFT